MSNPFPDESSKALPSQIHPSTPSHASGAADSGSGPEAVLSAPASAPSRPASSPCEPETVPPASLVDAVATVDPVGKQTTASIADVVPGYEILDKLGEGGMGVVYKARHFKLGRIVALKMILSGTHAGAAELLRFRTEGEAIARLQHPNIIQVHEVGEYEGKPFFSLEFCDGGSLERKLRGTPLPPVEAARLLGTLAGAMQAAHEKSVIHRDLKPANVLLSEDGTPKITDFGLAKKLDDVGQTQSGAIMGTPSYMAPEQAGGKTRELGPACDIYALGAILYELLTGRPPFKAATVLDTLNQVVDDEPVPPSRLQSKTPCDLETICLKCLAKEPGKRYATAAALAEELGRFQRCEPIMARPVGRVERGWRWCKRNPALAALGLALLVATPVSAYFAVAASQQSTQAGAEKSAAVAARQNLGETNKELIQSQGVLQKSNDGLATSVVSGLLGPLALHVQPNQPLPPLSDPEIDVLWELASTEEETLRFRFVEVALREPGPTRQLKDRAAYALHAAVGLNSAWRTRMEQLLEERLRAKGTTPEQRVHVALALAYLGIEDSALAGMVGQALTEAITRTTNPYAQAQLAQGLSAVAGRMEPKEAAAVCGQATTSLSLAMTNLASTKTTDNNAFGPLSQGLSAVAAQMQPKEAATILSLAMTKTTDYQALPILAQGLLAVAVRMEPEEAAAVRTQAASALSQCFTKSKVNWVKLVNGVQRVAGSLKPKEAAEAAAILSKAMTKTTNPYVLWQMAEGLSVFAGFMEPKEAAAVCGREAASLRLAMTTTTDRETHVLVFGLSALAAHLEPKEAAEDAAAVSQAMTKTTNPIQLEGMTRGLLALAARMEPKEATAVCGQAAASIRLTMTKTTNPYALQYLAQGLSALAIWMEPKEAAESVASIQLAMSKTTAPYALQFLAQGLSALAARMEPKEAAAMCDPVAASLSLAMTKTTESSELQHLAEGLSALALRMEPKEAAVVCGKASDSLSLAMTKTTDHFALQNLAKGLSALAARMEPGEAANVVSRAMSKTNALYALELLAHCLSVLSARLKPKEAAALCSQAAASLSQALTETQEGGLREPGGLAALSVWMDPKEAAASFRLTMTKTTDGYALWELAHGLSAVSVRMDPKEAAETAAHLSIALTKRTDTYSALPEILSAVLLREDSSLLKQFGQGLDPLRLKQRRQGIAGAVGVVSSPKSVLVAAALLQAGLEMRLPPLPAQTLVDILKQPLCVGEARRLVLEQLSRHYQRPFADQWDFVRYAEEQKLGLNLTTPPQRPGTTAPER
jgi:serine/threonine protein kinase